jgi:RimJ/RimL family protein N-acetyltransferase
MSFTDLAIPTLETDRLILRGPREADVEAMVAIWQDPVVMAYFHGKPLTRQDIWARFLKGLGLWALRGFGLFAIEERATGAYIGTAGAFEVKREMIPRIEDMPEVGWTLAARFHGKGYATEAVRAALAWTDEKLGHPEMFCIVAPANEASVRVAEKCGFRHLYETIYEEVETLVMKRRPTDTSA